MKLSFSSIAAFALLAFFSCKNEITVSSNPEVLKLETAYNTNPNEENFQKLINSLSLLISKESDQAKKEDLLQTAIQWSEKTKNSPLASTFAVEMIKTNVNHPLSKQYLWVLAEDMKKNNKPDISKVLFKGFADLYPDDSKSNSEDVKSAQEISDMSEFIKKHAVAVFENPGERGINVLNTEKYIDICEAYALTHPKDTLSSEYLFRAAEMARALGSNDKSLSLYEWIGQYFKDSKNAPMAIFLKGFMLENEYKQLEQAKQSYQLFLSKYPDHAMAKDVTFLLENIGKSDKEIMDKLEKK